MLEVKIIVITISTKNLLNLSLIPCVLLSVFGKYQNFLRISRLGLTLDQNMLEVKIIVITISTKNLLNLFLIHCVICVLLGILGQNQYFFANISLGTPFRSKYVGSQNNCHNNFYKKPSKPFLDTLHNLRSSWYFRSKSVFFCEYLAWDSL